MQVIASVCIQRVKQRLLNADVSDTDIYMSASLGAKQN